MKFAIALAAVLAVSTAQLSPFRAQQPFRIPPSFPFPSPSPIPRPTPGAPLVNRVATSDQAANIITYDNDISPDGSYSYRYQTDNGIAAEAQGVPRDLGGNPPVIPIVSSGSFSWTSPEGQPIAISYVADENGYQPSGDSIPTPPPIPEAILRALDYIAKNPPQQKK